jgi:hydantoinase/carbamoylase family amidase
MPINIDRIRADIDAIAACTATPGAGADRPTFSPQWAAARNYVIEQATLLGCQLRTDAAGNLHARPKGIDWTTPAWLCGSHIDSVPCGGNFDGVVGVVTPLEVLRASHEDRRVRPLLELIIFAEEEGTTFGLGMIGSRAWVNALGEKDLARVRNSNGDNYLEAAAKHGVRASRLLEDRLEPRHYLGMIETHIEQGPGMWNSGAPLAVVTAVSGRRQYRVTLSGVANHAGSTSMHDRRDALVGAATLVLQLEGLARGLAADAVITVGRIECRPNAINVIPGEVRFTIDFRSADRAILEDGDIRIRDAIRIVAQRRGLEHDIEETENARPVEMDYHVIASLERASAAAGVGVLPRAVSGALHDAAVIAPHLPTAMLFIASRGGISHNPSEFSRFEDISAAARVLYELVTRSP